MIKKAGIGVILLLSWPPWHNHGPQTGCGGRFCARIRQLHNNHCSS